MCLHVSGCGIFGWHYAMIYADTVRGLTEPQGVLLVTRAAILARPSQSVPPRSAAVVC